MKQTKTPYSKYVVLRYSGGKRKVAKRFVDQLDLSEGFTDVFVGGGSVLVEAAVRDLRIPLVVNDLDPWIAAFWRVVVGGEKNFVTLRNQVIRTVPTLEQFYRFKTSALTLNQESSQDWLKAFYAIYFNRTTTKYSVRSGPIGGEGQDPDWARKAGVDGTVACRWNGSKIVEQLDKLRSLLCGRLTVYERDFADVPITGAAYYDPPYYVAGSQLYLAQMADDGHIRLSKLLQHETRGNWLLSYDNCPEIRDLYKWAHIVPQFRRNGSKTKKKNWDSITELLIQPWESDE